MNEKLPLLKWWEYVTYVAYSLIGLLIIVVIILIPKTINAVMKCEICIGED
ncbi:MAG: hypothetical protein J7L15_07500 [Clostridiales bacterium]|nr:hypothetical protein [Clostridiales bacterium]